MRRSAGRVLCGALICVATACGGNTGSGDERSSGSVYVAALRHLDVPGPDDTGDRTIVYVADMNSEPLDLDEQVSVIGDLEADVDLRFIDDIAAAARFDDDGTLGAPDDGWLVAVGTPVDHDDVVTVRVEAAEPGDKPSAWQLRLRVTGDVSVVAASDLEPEFLVPPVAP